MVVGDDGVILASNPIEPVLNLEIDHAAARLRLTLAGPSDGVLRLEFSKDLMERSYLGTYTIADPPLWFDLPSGAHAQPGFYRVVLEPQSRYVPRARQHPLMLLPEFMRKISIPFQLGRESL